VNPYRVRKGFYPRRDSAYDDYVTRGGEGPAARERPASCGWKARIRRPPTATHAFSVFNMRLRTCPSTRAVPSSAFTRVFDALCLFGVVPLEPGPMMVWQEMWVSAALAENHLKNAARVRDTGSMPRGHCPRMARDLVDAEHDQMTSSAAMRENTTPPTNAFRSGQQHDDNPPNCLSPRRQPERCRRCRTAANHRESPASKNS